jgi:hypothetical protein
MADYGHACDVFNAQDKIQITGQLHDLIDIIRKMPSTPMAMFLQFNGLELLYTMERDEINHSALDPLRATRIYVDRLLEFTYALGSLAQSIFRHDDETQETIDYSTIAIWAHLRRVDRNNPQVSADIYNRMILGPPRFVSRVP